MGQNLILVSDTLARLAAAANTPCSWGILKQSSEIELTFYTLCVSIVLGTVQNMVSLRQDGRGLVMA